MRSMHSSRRGLRATLMIGAVVVAAGCGGSSSPTATTGGTTGGNTGGNTGGTSGSTSTSISVQDNSFSPSETTVPVGSTVTWTWTGVHSHNVAFDDGSGLKSAVQTSGTYSRTFASAGTYSYHCEIHGAAMSGTITVK